jgi:ADP-heptose:LPS heptosyltransferase
MKFLIIQTAFLGDVILATPILEKLKKHYPEAEFYFLCKKGNESLLKGHPFLKKVWLFDKSDGKLNALVHLTREIRKEKFYAVINLHRFASSGMITAFSGAELKIGFDKNPFSFFFDEVIKHRFVEGHHEVHRNLELVKNLTDDTFQAPVLYPTIDDEQKIIQVLSKNQISIGQYYCIAPSSVWFTKQLPEKKWIELLDNQLRNLPVFILGAQGDSPLAERLKKESHHTQLHTLCGDLSLLQSAALMKKAKMNFVNDSGPMHLASALNATVTAFFCSTVPAFGFYPLSEEAIIIETKEELDCRPCGLHGFNSCPKGHFRCGETISLPSFK